MFREKYPLSLLKNTAKYLERNISGDLYVKIIGFQVCKAPGNK
jgi:hypothetical protein